MSKNKLSSRLNIVNVGYASTNYYVLQVGASRLLVDVGMPGTFGQLRANLKAADIALPSISYLLVTHYHPDHAGIVEEVKAEGVRLVVMEPQLEAIELMKRYIKPDSPYIPIRTDNNVLLAIAESRSFLQKIGLAGEIITTPGHSDDSVSLVLDDGNAWIGDLTPPMMADEPGRDVVANSWAKLANLHVKHIYAGHAPDRAFATYVG